MLKDGHKKAFCVLKLTEVCWKWYMHSLGGHQVWGEVGVGGVHEQAESGKLQ